MEGDYGRPGRRYLRRIWPKLGVVDTWGAQFHAFEVAAWMSHFLYLLGNERHLRVWGLGKGQWPTEGSLSQPCHTAQPFLQAPTSGTMKGGSREHTRALCCVREDKLS